MVKFQASAFAAATSGADERALPAIARPDAPPNRRRNVAGSCGDSPTRLWSSGRSPLGLLEVLHQHRQGAIDDRRRVAIRNGVPQQVLGAAQRLIGLLAHRELQPVTRRRQWGDDRPARGCHRPRRFAGGLDDFGVSATGAA